MKKELQNIDNRVLTDHGLNLPVDITEDEFFEVGKFLGNIEHGLQWAVGDWYNNIPDGKGNSYSSEEGKAIACKRVGINYNTARRCGMVTRVFTMDQRRSVVNFTGYTYVSISDLTDEQRQDLLRRAEIGEAMKNGKMKSWSSKRLLKERDILLGWWEEPIKVDDANSIQLFIDKVGEGIPDRYKKKVQRLAETTAKQLAGEFEAQVLKAAAAGAKKERGKYVEMQKKAAQELVELKKARKRVNQVMTKKEFQLVRACLHPDKHDGNPKYGKAFEIFNRLLESIDAQTYETWSKG